MKIKVDNKVDNKEYTVDFKLPENFENEVSVQFMMDSWVEFNREQIKKEKRDLRVKKLNEINEKGQKRR